MGLDDLITALASPPGAGATGIMRISGASLRAVLDGCFQPDNPWTWQTSKSAQRFVGKWRLAEMTVPCGLMFWPTSRSYTGQPTAELLLPGSPPLLERVQEELHRRGVRPAQPGEFTLRAFLAGKIDLVQAEAVLGVIDAQDEDELKLALDQLAGGISFRLIALRTDLLELLAELEAGLDFVEEDIEFVTRAELADRILQARMFVASLLTQSSSRMTSRTLPKVVLAGLPNAGKSTLFNRLAGESLALVSPDEGTTRDYLQTTVSCDGIAWELIDTAGWDVSAAGIAEAAQDQRADQFGRASLVVWCSAADQTDEERQLDDMAFSLAASTAPLLRAQTKCELSTNSLSGGRQPPEYRLPAVTLPKGPDAPRSEEIEGEAPLAVSVMADFGLDDLQQRIAAILKSPAVKRSGWLGMTAARCRDSLEQALAALRCAETAAGEHRIGDELLAVDLREALDHLGTVVGAVYTDDLLDRIFSKFCIGK